MKKYFFVFIFAIFLVSFVSAYQEKMTVKECLFSLDDDSFSSWDGETGVFLNITNTNLNLGVNENANYIKTSYQPSKKYFNNFESTDKDSYIPMLQVKPELENFIYIKCTYKIGDFKILPNEYALMYLDGTNAGLFITHDFNLTNGLISRDNDAYKYSLNGITQRTDYNSGLSPISYFSDRMQYIYGDQPYYIDNKVDLNGLADLSQLRIKGFHPFTEPVVYSKVSINKFASGVLYGPSIIRENAFQSLFDYVHNYFYVNSTTQNITDMIVPTALTVDVKNLNSGKSVSLNSYYSQGCYGSGSLACLLFNWNDNLQLNFTFENKFSTHLDNVQVVYCYYSDTQWGGGAGYVAGTDIKGFTVCGSDFYDFAPNEKKSFLFNSAFPSNRAGYFILSSFRAFRENINAGSRVSLSRLGSDNIPYLGFLRYDPRIEMKVENEAYHPIFSLNTQLFLFDNSASDSEDINPGDYSILVKILNSTNKEIDSISVLLDQQAFSEMTPSATNSFISGASRDKNNLGWIRNYILKIPIKDSYLTNQGGYFVQLYSVKNTEPFNTKKISGFILTPSFEPGDLIYSVKNRLDFGNDSKIDSGKVFVFNPTFYPTTIELRLKWSDDDNFMFKWEGESFQKNPVKRIFLNPLERIELTFYVNATHKPWINSPKLEDLEMTANATLYKSETEKILKTSRLNFVLNLTTQNLRWFNLNPTGYSPNEIKVDILNPSKNQAILVNWTTEGTDLILPDYSGKTYLVNLTLKNSEGNILNKTSQIFTITQLWKRETLGISYNFSVGAYSVFFDLDSKNEIIEKNETENKRIYPVNVIFSGCEYNATEHKVYIRNSFGNLIPDTSCNCECEEPSLTCEIGTGFCRNPSSDCSGFSLTNTCNDAPSPFWCAWNCTSATCPPGNNRNGDCKNCDSFGAILGCSGYNNNDTCIKDSCNRKEDHCNNIKNSGGSCSGTYYCTWTAANNCELFVVDSDGPGPGGSCTWRASTIQDCTGNNEFLIVNNSGSPSRCGSYEQKYPCGQILEVPFFTFFNLFSVLVLITIFYIYKKHY